MDLTLVILTLILGWIATKVLMFLLNYWKTWKNVRHIPIGPPSRAYPFIGHALAVRGNPDDVYAKIIKWEEARIHELGNEISLSWNGTVPIVSAVGPNAAEVILRSSNHLPKSFFYSFLHSWLGTGLLTAEGEKWKVRRKMLTPTFHFSILLQFLEVMNEQADLFSKKLEKHAQSGQSFNICTLITLCTLDIICETAMGKPLHAQDNDESEYVKALHRMTELIQDRQKSPWLWSDIMYNNSPKGKEYKKHLQTVHSFTRSVLMERMEAFRLNNHVPRNRRLAFLDLLLNISTEGDNLSLDDIQEEVDTFMFEGHDTTASGLAWSIHMIGSHPDVQLKIQKELDEVLGKNLDTKITMEHVRQLEYLEMVIKESMRLFPPVPLIGRTTTCDCTMDGHHVPAGTQCLIYTQVINKNVNFWTDPEKFAPDRFLPENSVGRHPFSYLPFSAGPRNCIGQKFALMEEKVILASLLRKYSITSCHPTEKLKIMGDIILRSGNGIQVTLTERS